MYFSEPRVQTGDRARLGARSQHHQPYQETWSFGWRAWRNMPSPEVIKLGRLKQKLLLDDMNYFDTLLIAMTMENCWDVQGTIRTRKKLSRYKTHILWHCLLWNIRKNDKIHGFRLYFSKSFASLCFISALIQFNKPYYLVHFVKTHVYCRLYKNSHPLIGFPQYDLQSLCSIVRTLFQRWMPRCSHHIRLER